MLIGLVGYKGSGKTTACNIIKKHLDDVVQLNFKDALIEELIANFPELLLEIALIYGYIQEGEELTRDVIDLMFAEKKPLVRALMKNYGTDVRRKEDPDYWVRQWMDARKGTYTLTDDVRFRNEAQTIKIYGGILIRLERTDLEATDQHLTETEQREIECDYTISVGKGELDKLEEELITILNELS